LFVLANFPAKYYVSGNGKWLEGLDLAFVEFVN
jgi:hypothetical protein